ncbi:murein DD-endopeptidase MepM/ murein hydrolase activator NlpD [Natranaerovirga pectinivora]|uniref:Murein DD-endopeptidase MepM/ murein hydrolase activator NlpD n=1 Tax=Natranaerovirga pectinivora TaxID=682400 RepID=A0A4R3MM34_9FIRM|nr:M23 family metallopeptidase [Natranaerovirga pectinivora]TCT14000.1 murein DD-endopeptidase MepM/ murein hydrolase activator NlpD [Natranaerovirga pectinivora]
MKKEKLLSVLKGKQFYYVLLLGFIAIFSISSIILSDGNKNKENDNIDIVDLNTPLEDEEDESFLLDPVTSDNLNTIRETEDVADEEVINEEIDYAENEVEDVQEEVDIEEQVVTTISGSIQIFGETVAKDEEVVLTFSEGNGLSWPIQGEIILPYDEDRIGIYFQTLGHYRVHEAMGIQGMIGTEVKAAARGIIKEISNLEKTGLTVTIEHGSGYNTVYGQLKDVNYKVGDMINEGAVLGLINEPTGSFVVEGSHLHFQVLKDGTAINPQNLLK